MNCPYKDENTRAIYEMTGINGSTEDYKSILPSEIIKSISRVGRINVVLATEFLNLFDPSLDQKYLFKIGSGIPVEQDLTDGILSTREGGEKL